MRWLRVPQWNRASSAAGNLSIGARWWTAEAPFVVLAAVIGIGYAYLVVGPRVLNPLDVSWFSGDSVTYYVGWSFFRREEHLTLPLGWSGSLGYPLGEPIAYLDSMPLVAALLWPFRDWLPDKFQYFGLFWALCCVLQFYFGFRISRRLCNGHRLGGILGGLFFLIAPIFTVRAHGHFPLTSQWLILAALDQFFQEPAASSTRQVLWRTAMCFIAAAINPYIAIMSLMVTAATYARAILGKRSSFGGAVIGAGAALVAVLVGLKLFGFLRSTDASQYVGPGYEYFALNLLDPISPRAYGALVLKEQPNTWGGYYLGLGLILLGLVVVARRPAALRYLLSRQGSPTVALFACSVLLALSTRAALGPHVIYHLSPPRPILLALATLRDSARLFWPANYLLLAGSIWLAARAFHAWRSWAVLALALLVQFADTAPLRQSIRDLWQTTVTPAMPSESAWHDLGRTQRHLVVAPPWQCDAVDGAGGLYGYGTFGLVALDQNMTINSFYAGRYSKKQIRYFCGEQISKILDEGLRSDTAYVFKPSMLVWLNDNKLAGKFCRMVAEYTLCSDVPGRSGLSREVLDRVPLLRAGDRVDFSTNNTVAASITGAGWSSPESWGRWTNGGTTYLAFRVANHAGEYVGVTLSILPFTPPGHPSQRIEAEVNGWRLPKMVLGGSDTVARFAVPVAAIAEDGLVRMKFVLPVSVSATASGVALDDRLLSIGVKMLSIDPL